MSETAENLTQDALGAKWAALKEAQPRLRIRNAAAELGVSEAELLATGVGKSVMQLEGDWGDFLKYLPRLGKVMSLTRNEGCVLEHKGKFEEVNVTPHATTVIGPIETRAFPNRWKFGFAVKTPRKDDTLFSFQFFDKFGDAVTKIYLQEASDSLAYDALKLKFKAAEQQTSIEVETKPEVVFNEFDAVALKKDWSQLKDTHDFFMLLRKHKANRQEAIESVIPDFARKINLAAIEQVLNEASSEQIPIMIFVANSGNIQIHQDYVKKIVVMKQWLNVLDPNFNMHLNMDEVESAYIVKKPTDDGLVHSIELFNKNKELVVQFFGLRKPGKPELETWRNLLSKI